MKFLLGTKGAMTTIYADDGTAHAVTEVHAGPCVVTQVKTKEHDGTDAIQVGFHTTTEKRTRKPQIGHLKGLSMFRTLREVPVSEPTGYQRGQELTVGQFAVGDVVRVSGVSKGKGFQGVVKRHGFHGHPATHGHKDQLRMSGAIGAGGPQRVFPLTRMAGRMGGTRQTMLGMNVLGVDAERNVLLIEGAVPGHRNTLVEILGEGMPAATAPAETTAQEPEQQTPQTA